MTSNCLLFSTYPLSYKNKPNIKYAFLLLLSIYRSICSAIKCPLEITADDYFVTSNGAVYDSIQASYIVLQIMDF